MCHTIYTKRTQIETERVHMLGQAININLEQLDHLKMYASQWLLQQQRLLMKPTKLFKDYKKDKKSTMLLNNLLNILDQLDSKETDTVINGQLKLLKEDYMLILRCGKALITLKVAWMYSLELVHALILLFKPNLKMQLIFILILFKLNIPPFNYSLIDK